MVNGAVWCGVRAVVQEMLRAKQLGLEKSGSWPSGMDEWMLVGTKRSDVKRKKSHRGEASQK